MHVLAAPDKFRGSATAPEVAAAIAEGVKAAGHSCYEMPMADGGEGLLDAFGGANRSAEVTGPIGLPVQAGWRLDSDGRAVIESARACGISLTSGAGTFDPVSASSAGVGELIAAALDEGALSVLVGLGGSATTDGGFGAVEVLRQRYGTPNLRGKVSVCCDVSTRFSQAATVFGPQKGADGYQVSMLEQRLSQLVDEYLNRYGTDVSELAGAGAAGGLAGGLAALGARLTPGFAAVAGSLGFSAELERADLVITGEGCLDASSFRGKVVGSVLARAARAEVSAFVVVGQIKDDAGAGHDVVSLSEAFSERRSYEHTTSSVTHAVLARLSQSEEPQEPAPAVFRWKRQRR